MQDTKTRQLIAKRMVARQQTGKRRRGSALVEFALVSTLLLTLTMTMIQYGIIMNTTLTVSHLSREGARYAAVKPTDDTNTAKTGIKDYIEKAATSTPVKYSDCTITVSPAVGASTRSSGNPITITISYPMSKKCFLPQKFLGVTIFSSNYVAQETMMIE
ncbi:MAG: pilus assembly protein [Armatimonadota bacterium]|nr:pilus assembly protein [Armatimonadota bacterium]